MASVSRIRNDLVMALGDVPSAVQTLVALADRIRTKGDPAAELILLPEGGELKPEHIEPVLKAFAALNAIAPSSTTRGPSWNIRVWGLSRRRSWSTD